MYSSKDNLGEILTTGRNTPGSSRNVSSRRNSVVFRDGHQSKESDNNRNYGSVKDRQPVTDQREKQRKGSATQREKDGAKMQRTKQKQLSLDGTKSPAWSDKDMFRPSTALENTYKLEPEEWEVFNVERTEKIISEVLHSFLYDIDIQHESQANVCSSIANVIKDKMKLSGINRYKIVAHVLFVQENNTSINYVSRCLWNSNFDNYATASYHCENFSAVGSVYASYYD